MTTGERIKEARKRAGLTQKQLADKLGISYVGIGQWENNQRNPKLETLQRIADALGVDIETIGGVSWNELSFSHNGYDFLREKLGYEEGAKEINVPDELYIKLIQVPPRAPTRNNPETFENQGLPGFSFALDVAVFPYVFPYQIENLEKWSGTASERHGDRDRRVDPTRGNFAKLPILRICVSRFAKSPFCGERHGSERKVTPAQRVRTLPQRSRNAP